jgi:hypothetical protein
MRLNNTKFNLNFGKIKTTQIDHLSVPRRETTHPSGRNFTPTILGLHKIENKQQNPTLPFYLFPSGKSFLFSSPVKPVLSMNSEDILSSSKKKLGHKTSVKFNQQV